MKAHRIPGGTTFAKENIMDAQLFVNESPRGLGPSRTMRAKFSREVAEAALPSGPSFRAPVTRADIEKLPETARRYLQFMEVVGWPRVWSFRAHATGVFRRSASEPWMRCEAWQYDNRIEITRIFHMRLRFRGLVPLYVRDLYLHGRGHMVGRVFDSFSVVDDMSEKVATGELVTYLNDAIFFAPSMVLDEANWIEVDDSCFDIALSDHGRTVTARVFVDEVGRVTDFSTTDRYGVDPAGSGEMVRARWSTPVRGWGRSHGRPVSTGGQAIWHFASGDLAYADFGYLPDEVEFDVSPRSAVPISS